MKHHVTKTTATCFDHIVNYARFVAVPADHTAVGRGIHVQIRLLQQCADRSTKVLTGTTPNMSRMLPSDL